MIPYDDLVVALQTWRARQGLPLVQMSGAWTPPPAAPVVAPPARGGSGPQRAAPPKTPPRPAQEETIDEGSLLEDASLDEHIDQSLGQHLDESHFGNDGDNFSIPFDAAATAHHDETEDSTSIGAPPSAHGDHDVTNPRGEPSGTRPPKRRDDW